MGIVEELVEIWPNEVCDTKLKDMVVKFQVKSLQKRIFKDWSQVIFKLLMHGSFEGSALKEGYYHILEIWQLCNLFLLIILLKL